jgi:hypothetical protein
VFLVVARRPGGRTGGAISSIHGYRITGSVLNTYEIIESRGLNSIYRTVHTITNSTSMHMRVQFPVYAHATLYMGWMGRIRWILGGRCHRRQACSPRPS